MNKTKIVCPQCGAEFAIPETTHVALGVVLGADSNLGIIHLEVVGQCAPAHNISSSVPQSPTIKSPKNMKADAKIAALREAGVNVANLFSMKGADGKETIARLDNGNLSIVPENDPIFAALYHGSAIPNSQLFRRWVMAQTFHMLATGNFTHALQRKGFSYQWKMLMEELKAQSKMWQHGDTESFTQRNRYFNKERVAKIADDYITRLKDHLQSLPRKLCKGVPYVHLKGKNIFTEDLSSKVIQPLRNLVYRIKSAKDPEQLYKRCVEFFKLVKKTWLVYDTPMAAAFKDSYKGAGAYFTMRNMIMFHGAKFRNDRGRFLSEKQSLALLEAKAEEYRLEGWRLFGVMKQLIKDSGMNIEKKIAEWRR